ncbi:MAG: MBL fold metallo-hydrolase [Bacillota bacterium]
MEVKTLAVGGLGTNCYILIEGDQCVVIDPGDEGDRILKALAVDGERANLLGVQAILLTHAHFDHTLAARYLQEKTGAPVFVGSKDKAMLSDPGWMKQFMPSDVAAPADIRTLGEGDQVALGGATLEVWETPGHSPGSLTFVLDAVLGSAPAVAGATTAPLSAPSHSPKMVFCGDLIFRRGVGRTDLPGGDPDQLFNSVDRVLSLAGKTNIYPGHGPSTTVGSEKAANPFL